MIKKILKDLKAVEAGLIELRNAKQAYYIDTQLKEAQIKRGELEHIIRGIDYEI